MLCMKIEKLENLGNLPRDEFTAIPAIEAINLKSYLKAGTSLHSKHSSTFVLAVNVSSKACGNFEYCLLAGFT